LKITKFLYIFGQTARRKIIINPFFKLTKIFETLRLERDAKLGALEERADALQVRNPTTNFRATLYQKSRPFYIKETTLSLLERSSFLDSVAIKFGCWKLNPGRMRSVREAGRGHEEQVLVGEFEVHDRHGRGWRHCPWPLVLEALHGHRTTTPTVLHAASTPSTTTSSGRRR
jgi:hypothetical protein